MKKLCEIRDVISVRIFPNSPKKRGPIAPMLMDDATIFSIINSNPSPKHFYVLDPKNKARKVRLTKENYFKTTEELFGKIVEGKIEDIEAAVKVAPSKEDKTVIETEIAPEKPVTDIETEVISPDDNIMAPETVKTDEVLNIDSSDIKITDSVETTTDEPLNKTNNYTNNRRYRNNKRK